MEPLNPYAPPRSNLQTGADATSAQPLASLGARFGARMLDGLVEMAPIIVGFVAGFVLGSAEVPSIPAIVLGYLGFVGVWIYQIVRMVKTGQTLGKKWLGIKIVRMDGTLVSFGGHLVRGLLYVFAGLISIVFIFRVDRRCLHDLAAESKVVVA